VKITPIRTIVGIALCAVYVNTLAQQTEQPRTLDTVVVTATRSERNVEDLPAAVSVIPRERIFETPGLAVDDVLRSMPSMDLGRMPSYQQHPTSNNFSMRGLLSGVVSHSLVMVDGVPINDSFSGFVQWSRVPNELVERVEIVRGGGSNLWGTYALGGVVNFITRQPKERESTMEVGYGSFNTTRANLFQGGQVAPGLKIAGNVNYVRTDSFQPAPESERMPLDRPTAYDAGSVHLQGNFDVDPSLKGYLRGQVFQNHQNLGSPLAKNEQNTRDLSGGATKKLGPGELSVNAFYHLGTFVTDNTSPITEFRVDEFLSNRHTTDVTDQGISAQWTQRVSKALQQVSFGVDYRLVYGQDTGDLFDVTNTQTGTDIGRGRQRNTGAYALVSLVPLSNLEVLASVRWDQWHNYNGFSTSTGDVEDKTVSATSPRLSLRYNLTSTFALRAAAYKAFNAPNLDNLYRTFSAAGFIGLPNSQLNPERLKGGEAGFDVNTRDLRLQVTAFSSTVSDAITPLSLSAGDPRLPAGFDFGSININAAKLKAEGVEAEALYSLGSAWYLDGAYTHVNSRITENPLDPTTVGVQIDGVPKNAASIGVSYRRQLGWSGGVRARYTDTFTTLFKKRQLDAVTVFDGYVAYGFNKIVSAFARVQNLFDKEYLADDSGFAPPQRGTPLSIFAGLRGEF